jgi:hypothetical protein
MSVAAPHAFWNAATSNKAVNAGKRLEPEVRNQSCGKYVRTSGSRHQHVNAKMALPRGRKSR